MFKKDEEVLTCPGTASDMKRVWAAGLTHPHMQEINQFPIGIPESISAPFPPLIQVRISGSADQQLLLAQEKHLLRRPKPSPLAPPDLSCCWTDCRQHEAGVCAQVS